MAWLLSISSSVWLSGAAFLKAETSYYLKSYADAKKEYDAFILTYADSPLKSQALYGMATGGW